MPSRDPASEVAYWRENFKGRPYAQHATSFDDYGPAYAYGVSSYARYPGRSFDEVEADLSRGWNGARYLESHLGPHGPPLTPGRTQPLDGGVGWGCRRRSSSSLMYSKMRTTLLTPPRVRAISVARSASRRVTRPIR